jgi:hypothetical protein
VVGCFGTPWRSLEQFERPGPCHGLRAAVQVELAVEVVDVGLARAQAEEVEDFDYSYGLIVDGGRVACFAEGRIGYREWARRNGRLADIHSIDDRYDHDIDELMA